jgi:hypothetical protein
MSMTSTSYGGQAREVKGKVIAIALVADPDLPSEIADDLATELPELLRDQIDARIGWEVSVRHRPLPVRKRTRSLIKEIGEWLEGEQRDIAICLTDLPLQADGRPVVAEASPDLRVGLVSLPALGPTHARERTREMVMMLVREVLTGRGELTAADHGTGSARTRPHPDLHREPSSVGVRFVVSPARGTLRLLAGMVRANRPWRLVLGLLGALTAAVATAALANLNNTVWRVAGALDTARLLILTLVSLATMTIWLLLVHRLWRRPSDDMSRRQAALFNATTVFTLLIGVGTLYVGLFVFNVLTGALVIDARPLSATLRHPVGVADYLRLAWFVSSVATVGGALGSGLERNAAVRAAAYRYQARQSGD